MAAYGRWKQFRLRPKPRLCRELRTPTTILRRVLDGLIGVTILLLAAKLALEA
jgi:hypothetical protein